MTKSRWILFCLVLVGTATFGLDALAASTGAPVPWQMYFRDAATPVMQDIVDFHNLILWIEVAIVLLVLGLMLWIIVKFNAKANPVPTRTTHNTALEIAWTVVPVLILLVIAVPSMKLLFFMDKAKNPAMTLKVVSHQWYWSYEYPDHDGFTFDSNLVPEDQLKPGQLRLLEVDNRVVLPADTEIRLVLTSDDVIHNWAVPSFGVKMDTVPGRLNEAWVKIDSKNIGTYYGQCSELCGVNHAFMPIAVDVVSKQDFQAWVEQARKKFAKADEPLKVVDAGTR
ncbi:MAG: cytochrome c oxidase subunit II [Acidobacteria bacterium RIFCSPLOWO2_12_FULL_67_14b]|nr:MAG: cytochrome c oxidase subunit II [Acidobacteria bacterium RIFCSPLOWO2_12_FULL_67_14b]